MTKSKLAKKSKVPTVQVIGAGEAFGSEFGNTSYLLTGAGTPTVLFDCGYQIPERLWKENLHVELDAVCLTHFHADHVFGIVPLLARYWEEKRTKPLTILGSRGVERYVRKLMEMGYPKMLSKLEYPIQFVELSESKATEWKGLSFTTARTVHSVLNLTIRVDFESKKLLSFAVSGDGQITEDTKKLVCDVGVLLQEVYTLDTEIPVHADLKTIEGWSKSTSIKKLAVSHQARSEVSKVFQRVKKLKSQDSRWLVLRPGDEISLERKTP